jgi:hypothetical protein
VQEVTRFSAAGLSHNAVGRWNHFVITLPKNTNLPGQMLTQKSAEFRTLAGHDQAPHLTTCRTHRTIKQGWELALDNQGNQVNLQWLNGTTVRLKSISESAAERSASDMTEHKSELN